MPKAGAEPAINRQTYEKKFNRVRSPDHTCPTIALFPLHSDCPFGANDRRYPWDNSSFGQITEHAYWFTNTDLTIISLEGFASLGNR